MQIRTAAVRDTSTIGTRVYLLPSAEYWGELHSRSWYTIIPVDDDLFTLSSAAPSQSILLNFY